MIRPSDLFILAAIVCLGACIPVHMRYVGPNSDHFDGRRFHDTPRTPRRGIGDALAWLITGRPDPWPRPGDTTPGPPPPRAVHEGVRVTWVGHATLLVQLDGVNVLTDPIWSERGTPLPGVGPRRVRPAAVRFGDLPPLHAVVVSHDHYDHMDLPTLRRLAARHHMPVLAGLNNASYLAWVGVPGGVDLDWWQCVRIGAVSICSVPAQHDSQRGSGDRSQSLWMGFWMSGPSGSVYFAGDTGWGPHFAEIRRRLGPTCVALLPIGAFRPRWFMRPVHISPDEAARAYRVLEAVHGVPMHYATFQLGDDEIDEPPRELARAVRRLRVTGFEPVPLGRGTDFRCPRTVPASAAPQRGSIVTPMAAKLASKIQAGRPAVVVSAGRR